MCFAVIVNRDACRLRGYAIAANVPHDRLSLAAVWDCPMQSLHYENESSTTMEVFYGFFT